MVSRTWIVIPLFNEAPIIGSVIKDLLPVFPHVVCIDDGSTDTSARAAREAGAVVVQHPVNLGQGAALQTGFEYVMNDPEMSCVVTFDADGQHRVADAADMVRRVQSGEADVVLGSRFLDGRTKIGPVKRLVLRTAALQTRWSTGMHLTDAHNGLRVMSRQVVGSIHLTQNRMAHASELIDLLSKLKPRWTEHPVEIIYTEYSKSKGQSLLNSVNIMADLLFR